MQRAVAQHGRVIAGDIEADDPIARRQGSWTARREGIGTMPVKRPLTCRSARGSALACRMMAETARASVAVASALVRVWQILSGGRWPTRAVTAAAAG